MWVCRYEGIILGTYIHTIHVVTYDSSETDDRAGSSRGLCRLKACKSMYAKGGSSYSTIHG